MLPINMTSTMPDVACNMQSIEGHMLESANHVMSH